MMVRDVELTARLYQANRFFRGQRPVEASCTHCDPFRQGGLLEISVPSFRCRHDAEGGCIMCNYGAGIPAQPRAELEAQFDACLHAVGAELETLLLSTNGSFLDEKNVPPELQDSLLRRARDSAAETVIIETHLDTLSPEELLRIRRLIPRKAVILEVGLESADPLVQRECYLKPIPLDALEQAIEAARELDMAFQLNVILGAPFLGPRDRMEDAERAVRWALDHGALAALFPVNIKPYTLLEYAYQKGLYQPLSHWAVPLLLSRFSPESLARVDLAWYGNREIRYETPGVSTVFPRDCPACRETLQAFYRGYVRTGDGALRRRLVQDALQRGGRLCGCMDRERSAVEGAADGPSHTMRVRRALAAALAEDGMLSPGY